MMKKTITMMLLILATVSATAQEETWSKWTITPRVGMTVSSFAGKYTWGGREYMPEEDSFSYGVGGGIGVEAECRPSKLVGISLGVFYEEQNVVCDQMTLAIGMGYDGDVLYNIHYIKDFSSSKRPAALEENCARVSYEKERTYKQRQLMVPLMLNFHVWKGLTLKAGIEYSRLLGAREKSRWLISELASGEVSDVPLWGVGYHDDGEIDIIPRRGTTDPETGVWIVDPEYHIFKPGPKMQYNVVARSDCKKAMKRHNMSIPLAVSYEYKNFELEARYHLGITRLFEPYVSYKETRNSSFLLSLGYKFHL